MPLKNLMSQIRFSDEKMQKVNLFENERFFCDVYCLRAGQEQRTHVHEAEEKVYFVMTGQVIFRDGAEEKPGSAGDALWCRAGEQHGVRNDGPEDATLLVFMAPHPNPSAIK